MADIIYVPNGYPHYIAIGENARWFIYIYFMINAKQHDGGIEISLNNKLQYSKGLVYCLCRFCILHTDAHDHPCHELFDFVKVCKLFEQAYSQ